MAETDSTPIAENEQVKELLALLKENNAPGYEEFSKLIGHVSEMEQRLSEATEELKAMRREMQGLQNHSLKDSLQKSCIAIETNLATMHQRLSKLKEQIIDGCRNILTDFKERGAVALNGITRFLHIRPALEAVQNASEKGIQACNRAVSRIDAFSTEYHEAGRHFKNMGRTLQGKPAEAEAKENGKLASIFKGGLQSTAYLYCFYQPQRGAVPEYPRPVGTDCGAPPLRFEGHAGAGDKNGVGKETAVTFPRQGKPVIYRFRRKGGT